MRLVGEGGEELELLAGKVHGVAADCDDPREPVDRQVADLDELAAGGEVRRSTARIRASNSS